MPASDDFAALMQRVLSGCKEAADQLHAEYGPHIRRVVQRHLHRRLRTKFDSSDFVQDVWASFFIDLPTHANFDTPESLVAYLTAMARNKVAHTTRRRMKGSTRNINREQPFASEAGAAGTIDIFQPTPSAEAMGREAWEDLLKRSRPVERRVLTLVRAGKSPDWIADHLGITVRHVRRMIRKAFLEIAS
jgi:RNA polymerase sigma-70 factor (ECF subfamily)